MIKLTIPGDVVPQGRPRFARRGNFVQTYDPAQCRNYKAYIRLIASQAYKGPLLEEALMLYVTIFRLPPTSWSKTKIALALAGDIRPTTKPDLSNSIKGIEDALKGLIWHDDSQIVMLFIAKYYSNEPRAEVTITPKSEVTVDELRI
jgi:Holliday junction resolvase RusA-like endonuclease